jgi:acyl-CoA dehydrogenase
MDVHGGKAISEGPRNYLGSLYRGVPIGITVEGANIVTRSLIQFGQGAIRCHPYLLKEMMALEDPDRARGLDAFDAALWGHVRHGLANAARAFLHAWTGALFAPAPQAAAASKYYRQLSRYSAAFALAVDLALLTLGGGLKRKEMLSARFGDILSELYLASAALKRWDDEGRQQDDLPLLAWCMQSSFATIEARFDEIFANMPNRPVAWLLRAFILPFGRRRRGPSDRLTEACAAILTNPGPARERLVADLYHPAAHERDNGLGMLERAFALSVAVQAIRDRMRKARVRDIGQAERQRTIDAAEAAQLREAAEAVAAAIAVDDFAPQELTSRGACQQGDVSSPAILQPTSPATPDEFRFPPAAAE